MDSYIVRKLKAFEKTKSNSSKKYYSNSPLPHSYLKLLRWLNFRSISTGANCTPTRINGNQRTDTASSFPVRFPSIAPLCAILLFKTRTRKKKERNSSNEFIQSSLLSVVPIPPPTALPAEVFFLYKYWSHCTSSIALNESDRSNSTWMFFAVGTVSNDPYLL